MSPQGGGGSNPPSDTLPPRHFSSIRFAGEPTRKRPPTRRHVPGSAVVPPEISGTLGRGSGRANESAPPDQGATLSRDAGALRLGSSRKSVPGVAQSRGL